VAQKILRRVLETLASRVNIPIACRRPRCLMALNLREIPMPLIVIQNDRICGKDFHSRRGGAPL
jgi:hypothetical protein